MVSKTFNPVLLTCLCFSRVFLCFFHFFFVGTFSVMMPGGTGTVKKAKDKMPPSADADAGHRRDL